MCTGHKDCVMEQRLPQSASQVFCIEAISELHIHYLHVTVHGMKIKVGEVRYVYVYVYLVKTKLHLNVKNLHCIAVYTQRVPCC